MRLELGLVYLQVSSVWSEDEAPVGMDARRCAEAESAGGGKLVSSEMPSEIYDASGWPIYQ